MKNFLVKNKVILIILFLVIEGLFLRTFHLADWLHFQLDQSRDAFLIKEVIQKGIGDLPLLGPRAGGSFLRLGPAYYYLMYALALLARSFQPVVYVLPVILGSIAFVPLFYRLARRLSNENWSLILTALAVNSTFLITYDRFSWNPNLLPLFTVLAFYAWLKYLDCKKQGDYPRSLKWAALVGLVAGIFTQLHFVAFVAVPLILIITAIVLAIMYQIYFPELAKKYFRRLPWEIGVLIAVFLLTNTPLFLNDYLSKGANVKEFFSTVSEKEGKDLSHSPSEKLIQNLWVYPKGYFIATTGVDVIDFPVWRLKPQFNIICDDKCRKSLAPTVIAAAFFFLSALSFLILLVKRTKNILALKKTNPEKKKLAEWEFLLLLAIWILVPWWAFYSLSFTLRPRFFLFSIVPFWIIFGLLLRELARNNLGKKIGIGLVLVLLVSNIANTVIRFNRLAGASVTDIGDYPQDQILFQDESYPVTLNQEQAIADWIKAKNQNGKDYLFLWAPSFYYRPILYLMSDGPLDNKLRYFSNNPMWENAQYFAVSRTAAPEKFFKGNRGEMFESKDYQVFGTLTVYELGLTEKGLADTKQREKKFLSNERISDDARIKRKCLEKPKATCRYTWGDLLNFKR